MIATSRGDYVSANTDVVSRHLEDLHVLSVYDRVEITSSAGDARTALPGMQTPVELVNAG